MKELIKKYKTYISNLEWHLENNMTDMAKYQVDKIKQRITDFEEIVRDLKQLTK